MYRLAVILVTFSCTGGSTRRVDEPPLRPKCGDGVATSDEECDGSDLKDATCVSLGFEQGSVTCAPDCTLAKSLCTTRCGNGVIDVGEACDGALGITACATFGYVACTRCELDRSHCVTPALETGPVFEITKGGPAVIGDLAPRGPGDLVMAVPAFSRLETFPWTMAMGFTTTGTRKLSFQRSPARVFVAELNGDTNADIAALNDDGSLDAYVFNGNGFTPRTVLDGGCTGGRFAGRFASDSGVEGLSLRCGSQTVYVGRSELRVDDLGGPAVRGDFDGDGVDDHLFVDATGLQLRLGPTFGVAQPLLFPGHPTELVAADFDGDGDLDLAGIVTDGVALYENTGGAFADQSTIPAAGATDLFAGDLDLDGNIDLLWVQDADVVVRRNKRGWLFSEHRSSVGSGTRVSVAVGDADGDGDLDAAVTVAAGLEATRTRTVLNRVR